MSLAEELLADFEDGVVEEEEIKNEPMDTKEEDSTVKNSIEINKNSRITEFAKLVDSEKLKSVTTRLEHFMQQKRRIKIEGSVEADPEYICIVDANNLVADIDTEVNIVHKYCQDIYSKRFPELVSLVPDPMQYIKTAHALMNEISEKSTNIAKLSEILPSASIMVITVTSSTTQGVPLNEDEVDRLTEACQMAIQIYELKNNIIQFVESRMSLIAPNISMICGSSCAARIIGQAGGLINLSKMPACNIFVLGAQKKILSGFSTSQTLPHTGYIYKSDMIQKLPPDIRIKATRLYANKLALTARIDSLHESQDGSLGVRFKNEIDSKIEKWLEPPPVKFVKPLPAPIDPPSKKRGGRRYRKMKERMGMSDMRKTANRMQFGEISDDAYQEDLGYSSGSLGKKGIAGKIRAPQVDMKTRARVSKSLQQKLNKYGGLSTLPTSGMSVVSGKASVRGASSSSVAGTASVAFTPAQGLEIVNPKATEKAIEETNKYFSHTAGFSKVTKNQQEQKKE